MITYHLRPVVAITTLPIIVDPSYVVPTQEPRHDARLVRLGALQKELMHMYVTWSGTEMLATRNDVIRAVDRCLAEPDRDPLLTKVTVDSDGDPSTAARCRDWE